MHLFRRHLRSDLSDRGTLDLGGGFLASWGFHDYAGSNCIHMVGGICAFIGAWMLGPRIGKFERDKNGKVTKVNAFPGHNLVIAALGVFILWLGWYGFNGAAATTFKFYLCYKMLIYSISGIAYYTAPKIC